MHSRPGGDGTPAPPGGGAGRGARGAVAGVGDLEEGVELGELEQGLQVVVEVGEPQLSALLANLLRERDEDAESRTVDVARLGEIDEEFLLAALQLVENLLLELLSVANDQLAFYINHDDVALF